MKRSDINQLILDACAFFGLHSWHLPPNPRWDVTDFGLGDWQRWGLVLVNLTEQPEYCEKVMYARRGMVTPAHCHLKKKEDIVCRVGSVRVTVWGAKPEIDNHQPLMMEVNGEPRTFLSWDSLILTQGERITLVPGIYHEFEPNTEECIIGEVSTANDDLNDNIFANSEAGRFSAVMEDAEPLVKLVSDKS